MKFDKIYNLILERVFHGSEHEIINGFDENKIGLSGASAYGWGAYFSEDESYAKTQGKGHNIDMNGKMYHVDIEFPEDNFLKLDYPIKEQSKLIKDFVKKFKEQIDTGSGRYGFNENDKGMTLYNNIRESFGWPEDQGGLERSKWDRYGNKQKNTSIFLSENGIKGGIFFTSTKNGIVKNYVIYDLSILKNLQRIY